MSVHSLTSEIGIRSRSHDCVGEELRISRMSSSDTDSKEERMLLLLLGLVAETGTNDCSAILIFTIISLKNAQSCWLTLIKSWI